MKASGSHPGEGGSVGSKTWATGTAFRVCRPSTLARIQAGSSSFSGAAVLGNWTSQPERDQTRVISSVINSGSHLFCALIYLQTIQSPKALLTTVDSQERALGGGALRAGFHPWCVALDRCTNHTADIAWSPQLQFLASMQLTKGKRKAFSKNTQETRSFHYNSQPAMPRPLSSDNPLLLKFLWALLIA